MIHEPEIDRKPSMGKESADRILRVHYHRWDGNYRGAGLWTWDLTRRHTPGGLEILPAGEDIYGVYFLVESGRYGEGTPDTRSIGMVPRRERSWEFKDGGDRVWTPDLGYEVWLLQDDDDLHSSPPDIQPAIKGAWLDDWNRVRILLSRAIDADSVSPEAFRVVRNSAETIASESVRVLEEEHGMTRLLEIGLEKPLRSLMDSAVVEADSFRPASIRAGNVQHRGEFFGGDESPGAVWAREATTFRVFSPQAVEVRVGLYGDMEDERPSGEFALAHKGRGVWEGARKGDLRGQAYSLRVRTAWGHDSGWVADPFATNTIGSETRSLVTPMPRKPVVRPRLPDSPVDAVIAEVSVRDMTIHESSGAVARGTYAGLAERGTHTPADAAVSTGIEHLKELGVTHVQLMPCQDFDNDESDPHYNWGYMTSFFDSPEGWYASKVRGPERVAEFRAMVDAFHDAGIGVVMDVVYNHTGVGNTFEQVAPGYYHRRHSDGRLWNGSGTGNEVASEAPMARKFIVDSCRFWMEEYGVDGFRFDLMGLMDFETLGLLRDELRKIDGRVLLYGEPWVAAGCGLDSPTDKETVAGSGIGAFNDSYRDAVKGEPEGPWGGYAQNGSRRGEVLQGIAGSIDDWARSPADSVNYLTCHDNLTLWDKIAISSNAPEGERVRMQCLAMAILAVSQGCLFLHGGCEFLRTKQGHHNSYDAGDGINAVDWDAKRRHFRVFEYVRGLIAIRTAHPVFRLRTADEVRSRLAFHDGGDPACIAFTLDGEGLEGESWKRCAVLVNPLGTEAGFANPVVGGRFHAFDDKASPNGLEIDSAGETVVVPRRSLVILAADQ